jgi:septum formation protein
MANTPNNHPAESPIYDTHGVLVLASGSPRRRDFFDSLGLRYIVDVSTAEEPPAHPTERPEEYARRMAGMKAREVARRHPGATVLAADTVVALDDLILGKPTDEQDALRMLTLLAGHTHQVVTGCYLLREGKEERVFHAVTDVRMRQATQEELRAYVATGEPADKAGAYAIQGIGSFLVEHVHGSYTNVVGLPLARVLEVLLSWGVIVPRQG